MNKALIIVTIFLLSFGKSLSAQDLIEVYQLALLRDAELLIAESDYLAAVEAVPLAKSDRRPQIFLNANGSINESDNSNTGDNTRENIGYSINLTQTLYDTETLATVEAAQATRIAQLANLQEARQSLILRVAESYFDILAAQDNVEFAHAERTAIARQLEQAQKRFEVGLIAITDVHEAQARFDSADAQAILAENLLENAYQALQVIIGEPPSRRLAKLGDNLSLSIPDPANTENWVSRALRNNRALLAAQAALKAANFERQKQSKNRHPTIDFSASYSDADVEDELLSDFREDDLMIAIELNMPLYNGGRIDAERVRAAATYRSAQNEVLLQNRLASQLTRNAYLGVVSGVSQVTALKQALQSSNIAFEATQAGFEVGTRTSVDVLISLQAIFGARRDYARARYDYLINTIKLRQAAGILKEDDLHQINSWLVN